MISQSLSDRVKLLKEATHGELEYLIEKALSRIYPESRLSFSDLKVQTLSPNTIAYRHPQTDALIGDVNIEPEHIKTVQRRYAWQSDQQVVPHEETITLYSLVGKIDTLITATHATLPEGMTDRIRVVTGVREYYPPKKKRIVGNEFKRTPKQEEREASRNLRAARAIKAANGSAAPVIGAKTRLRYKKVNGELRTAFNTQQSTADQVNSQDLAQVNEAERGPIRRDRAYSLPKIIYDNNSRAPKKVTADMLSLNGRMKRERLNHPDGNYTVVQYTVAGQFNAVLYNESGTRLEQRTFSSEGELTKALGKSTVPATLRIKPKVLPSDTQSALRVRKRVAEKEFFEARREARNPEPSLETLEY